MRRVASPSSSAPLAKPAASAHAGRVSLVVSSHASRVSRSVSARASRVSLVCALAALVCGCAGGRDLATRLANAAVPSHLPHVLACWEKELEAASFRGEYRATVDFVVQGGTSKIGSAKVTKLEATDADPSRDPSAFRACIEEALNQSALPTEPDANGPGFGASSDISVTGYVIAFTDASQKARAEEAKRTGHVLIGPRADRCQGLYTYDPPRDEVDLFTAIDQADAGAAQMKADPDQYARLLQKAFDLRLELRDRLRGQIAAPDLPEANRKRLRAAIDDAEMKARAIGAAIGCKLD